MDKLERKDPRFTKVQITVDLYRPTIYDEDGFREGLTMFKIFPTDVSNDDGELIGMIAGGTGAVTLSEKGGDEWMIYHDDLWFAFQKAIENEKRE